MKFLKNLNLGTKLYASCLLIAIIGAITALYVVREYNLADERDTKLYEEMMVPVWHVGEISTNFQMIRVETERMVQPNATRAEIDRYADNIAKCRAEISEHQAGMEKAVVEESEKTIVAEYKGERTKYGPVLERVIALAKAGNQAEAESLADGELDRLRLSYQGSIERMFNHWVEEAKETSENNNVVAKRTQNIVLALIALGLGLSFTIATLVTRDIKGEVGGEPARIKNFAETIAGGDLTMQALDDAKVTGINQSISRMFNSLKSLIIPMTTGMVGLSASAEQVTAVASEVRRSTSSSADKLSSVAAAAEQMQTNMSSVAAAVEQSSTNLSSVATAAEELTATIHEIAMRSSQAKNISEGAVSAANETSEVINELAQAAEQIGKVTETISDISEQTKLLALNATIEAARAGEAGKGFAVVAQEIKELARQVATATSDISSRVTGIRQSTQKTKNGIGTMANVISEVNDSIISIASAVEEQSTTVAEIARNAQEVSIAVRDAADMVAQSTEAASSVAKDVAILNEESAGLASSTSQLDQSSDELTRMALEMRTLVSRFRV